MFRLNGKNRDQKRETWVFDKVASVEITRDIETLTDTCVLQLPKKVNGRVKVRFRSSAAMR